jgi:hypothetical protein
VAVRLSITLDDAEVRRFFAQDGFTKKFNRRFSQQMLGFHTHMKSLIKKQMQSGTYPPLGITQFIAASGPKSPTKTLRDTDGLMNSLHAHYVKESTHLTGVDFAFEGTNAKGFPYSAIVQILEEGRNWTPKHTERFKVAMMASRAGAPEPEGKPKMNWTIPGRPFLYDTFVKPEVWENFLNKTFIAIDQALGDLKSGT